MQLGQKTENKVRVTFSLARLYLNFAQRQRKVILTSTSLDVTLQKVVCKESHSKPMSF